MPEFNLSEVLWALFKWIHIGASTVWIGGSVFFAFVIRPLRSKTAVGEATRLMAIRYRELVGVVILVLLLSGVYLIFARVATKIDLIWILILAVKLSLVLWMIYIYFNQRGNSDLPQSPRWRRWTSELVGYDALLALGIVVLLLSSFLERATSA